MGEIKSLRQPKQFKSNVTILTSREQKASVFVPDGCGVAVLVRGVKPIVHPLDGAGEYEIDSPENVDDLWPVAVCVIDRAHFLPWENLTGAEVSRILDRCANAVERRKLGMPFDNGNPIP